MNHADSKLAHGTSGSPQLSIDNNELKVKSKAIEGFIQSNIIENYNKMSFEYPATNYGYFGEKGKNCRIIKCKDPIETSKDFYFKIGLNGKSDMLPNGKGTKTVLGDGTRIVHRIITSTKGSPAIEIFVSASERIKNQKIHFLKEDKDD